MSGVLCALAGPDAPQTYPPMSYTAITFSGGGGPFNVTGASGDLSASGYGIIQGGYSGGTPPITDNLTIVGGSGKAFITNNGLGADTVGYSGLGIGETITFYINDSVSDSVGAHFSSRYPTATTMSVTRTS